MTASFEAPEFPAALDGDDDDVAWALQTAAVQWNRGGLPDAIVWLRRAVDSALEVGAHDRAKDLNRMTEGLAAYVAAGGTTAHFTNASPSSVETAAAPAPSSGADIDALLSGDLPSVEVGAYEDASASLVDMVEFESRDEIPPLPIVEAAPLPPENDEVAEEIEEIEELDEVELLDEDEVDDEDAGETPVTSVPDVVAPHEAAAPDFDDGVSPERPASAPYREEDVPTGIRALTTGQIEQIEAEALVGESAAVEPGLAVASESDSTDESAVPTSDHEVAMGDAEVAVDDEEVAMGDAEVAVDDEEVAVDDEEVAVDDEEVAIGEPELPVAEAPVPVSMTRPRTVPPAVADTSEPSVGGVVLAEVRGFEDLPTETQAELASKARVETLGPEEEVSSFGLALVLTGAVVVMPTVADVPTAHAGPKDPVFCRGNLADGVAMRVVAVGEGTSVAVWQTEDFEGAMASCPWVAEELRSVADRFQALAGAAMGPLGDRLDDTMRSMITDRCEVKLLGAGEVLMEAGKPVPGLHIVGGGRLDADGAAEMLPGDILFAPQILGAGKAPHTVRAGEHGALVSYLDRMSTHELMMSVPPLLEVLAEV